MENKKYIRKNQDGKWIISNTKNGKSLRTSSTQKESIIHAWNFKDVTEVHVKRSTGWDRVSHPGLETLLHAEKKPSAKTTTKKKAAAKKATVKKPVAKTTTKKKTVAKKTATKRKTVKKTVVKKTTTKKKVTRIPSSKTVKISFNNITKKFGANVANKDIKFDVYENEVHALLGENGAGKSTLMSILFGLYSPTNGTISINGEVIKIKDPRHANELKIAMLPQHFKLVDNMTVVENVILGYENLNKDKGSTIDVLTGIANKFKLKIDLKAEVGSLPISDKQKVEILKILWRDADIIIFDEPTSILTPQEIEEFLKMVHYMKSIGKTILIITHKLPEIKEVADRVTIIRKGEYISTHKVSDVSEKKMADLMVGKAVNLNLGTIKREKVKKDAKDILTISNLEYKGRGYEQSLKDINFSIKEGEIVGIAAIDGNGQSELIKSIAGLLKSQGAINVNGNDIEKLSVKQRYFNYASVKNMDEERKESYKTAIIKFKEELVKAKEQLRSAKSSQDEKEIKRCEIKVNKFKTQINHTKILMSRPHSLVSHIPEDRHKYGLVLDYSVNKNAVLQDIDFYSKFGFINYSDVNARTNLIIDKYDVRGVVSNRIKARALSGGNQQKLILGREIERYPKLLLAAHPTRGLDVGAIRNVYENIISSRNKGMSVLLNSGELDEIMQVSDRIIVLFEGKIVSVTKRGELSKLQLGALMAGGKR